MLYGTKGEIVEYEILVDEYLEDGRVVVTNNSRADIPLGTLFQTAFTATFAGVFDDFQCVSKSPLCAIQLVVATVDVFRHQVACIPCGYSAAVKFDGAGVDAVRGLFEGRQEGGKVFLRTD
jgi:hypothetical protein